jgi:hypothetical protein
MEIKNKIIATTIIVLFLSSIVTSTALLQTASAHTPSWTDIPTHTFIDSVDTVGLGQQIAIIWWLDWIPPTSYGYYGDRWVVNVNIVKPDGTNDTFNNLISDPVGGAYITYTPAEMGNYTMQAFFPGQKLTGANSPPGQPSTNAYVNDTFAASTSKPAYFTVVQEQDPYYQETPLPMNYWERPVSEVNRAGAMLYWGNGLVEPLLKAQQQAIDYTVAFQTKRVPQAATFSGQHQLGVEESWAAIRTTLDTIQASPTNNMRDLT